MIDPQQKLEKWSLELGFTVEEILGHDRHTKFVMARKTIALRFQRLYNLPYLRIAKVMKRDHTSISHLINKNKEKIDEALIVDTEEPKEEPKPEPKWKKVNIQDVYLPYAKSKQLKSEIENLTERISKINIPDDSIHILRLRGIRNLLKDIIR